MHGVGNINGVGHHTHSWYETESWNIPNLLQNDFNTRHNHVQVELLRCVLAHGHVHRFTKPNIILCNIKYIFISNSLYIQQKHGEACWKE